MRSPPDDRRDAALAGVDRRSAAITAGILAVVVYGSLYPFDFHSRVLSARVLSRFWAITREHLNRGDVLSNVLLYLPLGFFAARIAPRRPAALRILIITAAASLLATGIEFAQFFDADRSPSIFDAASNGLGALTGAIAGVALRQKVTLAMLLLISWFGSRLIPFFPAIRGHKHALAIHALFSSPDLAPFDTFRYFALWTAAAALLDALFGTEWGRRALVAAVVFILAARVLITGAMLAPAEVVGASLAAAVWIGALSRLRWRARFTCALLSLFVILEALHPFHFLASARPFGWIPFVSFMDGPRESGSRVFLEKTFIYGSLVWLLRRAGLRLPAAAAAGFVLVFCLRFAQTYLPGRSAEMTDPAMVLILAGLFALLGEEDPLRAAPRRRAVP